ncbi:hypothetical protein [Pseudomonas fulva]|nr:hypothetical protein [Pseudomonas fulva]MBF8781200.1 hypothetical protein [Pseudomonas fulva]
MFHAILATVILLAWPAAQAASQPPRLVVPVPGAPGTATPTPYPQITPGAPVRAGDNQPGAPLLPPMPLPSPPKDQPLPGLRQPPGPAPAPQRPERDD